MSWVVSAAVSIGTMSVVRFRELLSLYQNCTVAFLAALTCSSCAVCATMDVHSVAM